MSIQRARSMVLAVALVELGAATGVLVAWAYLLGRELLSRHPIGVQGVLGAALWAFLVGAPTGAVLSPLLVLTALRYVALWRAALMPTVGLATGLVLGGYLHRGPALPVPVLTWVLAFVGLLVGALWARSFRYGANA